MNETIAAIASLQIMMLFVMVWQTVRAILTRRRLRRAEASLVRHQRALVSMHVAGMLSDDDWDRANTPVGRRRRTTLVIEPVQGRVGRSRTYNEWAGIREPDDRDHIPLSDHAHLQWTGQPARYQRWPKPPVGGAGNSGAADR